MGVTATCLFRLLARNNSNTLVISASDQPSFLISYLYAVWTPAMLISMEYTQILLLISALCSVFGDEHERRLFKTLFTNYSLYERPVLNHSDSVNVRFQIVLTQVVDVDEKNQTIQLNVWFKYEWIDQNLVWDPNEYGGVDHFSVTHGILCVGSHSDMIYPVNYILYSDGLVNWLPPALVKSSCIMDVAWFPFDEQRCHLKFGSWSYGSRKLDLNFQDPPWDMSEYRRNGEWNIVNATVVRNKKPYDCCRGDYIDLQFTLHLRRRTLYYGFNKIVPSLLIALTALLSFSLPVESIEKITLEITIFLSMYLFLDTLASVTPPTSDSLPFLGIFFSSIMILVSTSVLFNIMTLNLHYRTPYKCVMTPLMRKILLRWLPPLVFMRPRIRSIKRAHAYRRHIRTHNQNQRSTSKSNWTTSSRCNRDKGYGIAKQPTTTYPHQMNDPVTESVLPLELERVYREIRLIAREMKRKEDIYVRAESDWRYASRVIDRACLIIFFSLVVAASGVVAYSAHKMSD